MAVGANRFEAGIVVLFRRQSRRDVRRSVRRASRAQPVEKVATVYRHDAGGYECRAGKQVPLRMFTQHEDAEREPDDGEDVGDE